MRPPSASALFPYTTLFRSNNLPSSVTAGTYYLIAVADVDSSVSQSDRNGGARVADTGPVTVRSEEHTSELQSLRHLVCRLLLVIKNHAENTSDHASGGRVQ